MGNKSSLRALIEALIEAEQPREESSELNQFSGAGAVAGFTAPLGASATTMSPFAGSGAALKDKKRRKK